MKTVIGFEADGNLVNTMGARADLAADCMMNHFSGSKIEYKKIVIGLTQPIARKRYIQTTGISFPEQLEVIFPGSDYSDEARKACYEEYIDRKTDEVYKQAKLFEDVKPGLSNLKNKGINNFTVATSTEAEIIKDCLDRGGVLKEFFTITGHEYGSKEKHIDEIIKGLLKADKIFFVGDSPNDVGLSRLDGVTTIGRYGDEENGMHSKESLIDAGAKYVTNDFRDLAKFIKK